MTLLLVLLLFLTVTLRCLFGPLPQDLLILSTTAVIPVSGDSVPRTTVTTRFHSSGPTSSPSLLPPLSLSLNEETLTLLKTVGPGPPVPLQFLPPHTPSSLGRHPCLGLSRVVRREGGCPGSTSRQTNRTLIVTDKRIFSERILNKILS